jgi:hypothetical protein
MQFNRKGRKARKESPGISKSGEENMKDEVQQGFAVSAPSAVKFLGQP